MSNFKIIVKTDNDGVSNNDQFVIPLRSGYTYDFIVTGEFTGSPLQVDTDVSPTLTFLGGADSYEIEIAPVTEDGFPTIYFNNSGDKEKIIEISQWGDSVKWDTLESSFSGCSNLTITATDEDSANTGNVTNFTSAWQSCLSLTSFPIIDTSSGEIFDTAWNLCSSLASFPIIDTSWGTSFYRAWAETAIVDFPLLDLSSATSLNQTWYGCVSLESFPNVDTSSCTSFFVTWGMCSSLSNFPTIDMTKMTDGTLCFFGCTLSPASYSAILDFLVENNSNTSVVFDGGNSKYSHTSINSVSALVDSLDWTISDGGMVTTPITTLIEFQMKTLIEGMTVSGGYQLNWAPINKEDRALEDSEYDVFACVYWLREINQDEPEGLHFQAYHNIAEYSIEVRCPLTSESTNPLFDARPRLQLALSDLKKLFGTYSSLNGDNAAKTMYRSAEIMEQGQRAGDRFTPYYMDARFNVWYFQDRQDVFTTCM